MWSLFVIQALDGTICADRRPVGEDGTALLGKADGPGTQRTRQPALRRSGAVGGAHGQPVARPAGRLRQLEHRLQRSEEHTSELQSLMRISYAVFCLKKKKIK